MSTNRPKRHRRRASEIERKFICSICSRGYGYQNALNQHMKDKHRRATRSNCRQINKIIEKQKQLLVDPNLDICYPLAHICWAEDDEMIDSVPVYLFKFGDWIQTAPKPGDILLHIYYNDRKFAWELNSMLGLFRLELGFDGVEDMDIKSYKDGTACFSLIPGDDYQVDILQADLSRSIISWGRVQNFTNQPQNSFISFHVPKLDVNSSLEKLLDYEPRFHDMVQNHLCD
eukprot:TRINITY_DN1925_c0_g1_i6.p1 TRINITY_DN1925_c0_g1~~TRINITY_DN1925_c0_g1_i6.p1  ORF type:complete len:230 (+),score=47.32 TRINITY_DN1925_c0_g1_i6:20-709(+)